MKITIIRHAEPDYENNTLTEKGFREAKILGEFLKNEKFSKIYSSPYKRAQFTADAIVAQNATKTYQTVDCLREFDVLLKLPYLDNKHGAWDLHPEFLNQNQNLYDLSRWKENETIFTSELKNRYEEVVLWLNEMMKENGYEREGVIYNAVSPNSNHVVIVCHFGLESVILSHLLNIPVESLLNFTCARTSSVTTLVTEERVKGKAILRMLEFGSVAHLVKVGEEPSFMARFCEIYGNGDRILKV